MSPTVATTPPSTNPIPGMTRLIEPTTAITDVCAPVEIDCWTAVTNAIASAPFPRPPIAENTTATTRLRETPIPA